MAKELRIGNLEAKRDWGFAGDYVRAMWFMLQQDQPGDYVIGTGETHSVREFVEVAFALAGLDWRECVEVDQRYFRPAEVDALRADAAKARRVLGWEPTVTFEELVRLMVNADMADTEKKIRGGNRGREDSTHGKRALPWSASELRGRTPGPPAGVGGSLSV